jgi:hypothetical protein
MSATHPSGKFGAGHKEILSDNGQMTLLLFAVVFFAVSVALSLAFTDARAHRSPAVLQGWHDAGIQHVSETAPTRRVRVRYATTISPSSPTTSA